MTVFVFLGELFLLSSYVRIYPENPLSVRIRLKVNIQTDTTLEHTL